MGGVERVWVHIGPAKTGTTFIQGVLRQNITTLAAAGFAFPHSGRQHGSVRRLLAREAADHSRVTGGGRRDAWDRLVREVQRTEERTAVVSVEGLTLASPRHVDAIIDAFAPATVHLVYGARDLARVVPAYWQSLLRNGEAIRWADLLRSVRDPGDPDSPGAVFWAQYDPRQALSAWLGRVPAERVHVVTVPPTGSPPEVLWERFCSVLGMHPEPYDLDVPRVNISLGGVEAEVLRRVTGRVAGSFDRSTFVDLVKHFVARQVLEPRHQSFRLVLPEAEHSWLEPRAAEVVDYLRGGGFPVAGDLAELVPVVEPATRLPDAVDDAEVLALLDDVLAEVVLELARRRREGRQDRSGQDVGSGRAAT